MTLFGLPFGAVGGFQLYQGVRNMCSPSPNLFMFLFSWPVGIIFSLACIVLWALAFLGKEVERGAETRFETHTRLIGLKSPADQWRDGQLTSRGLGGLIGSGLLGGLMLLLTLPMIAVGIFHGFIRSSAGYRPWCLAGLLPLYFVTKAIYRWLRWKKFGTSFCDVVQKPSASNRILEVVVRPQKSTLPDGRATVELRCEKREIRGYGRQRHLDVQSLWQEKKATPVQSIDPVIHADFDISTELPDASPSHVEEGIFWVLTASCAEPGIDYFAEFSVALSREKSSETLPAS